MKKEIIRREAIKLKLQNKTSKEITIYLKQRFDYSLTRMTLNRWMKRFNQTDWDFRDISQRPKTIHHKFTEENKITVIAQRKKQDIVLKNLE